MHHLDERLKKEQNTWLITGVAGFIGSHLLEYLLKANQKVIGLDNFVTGKKSNLEDVKKIVGAESYSNFKFVEGTIEDPDLCLSLCKESNYVLHQAALGSVSRSVAKPKLYNDINIGGFLNMLIAARDAAVKKFVYASSSSVYGDEPGLPKREEKIGKPLSPYALSKLVNEQYAALFADLYSVNSVGLRYFNVFGPRQDPEGEYAAVIPRWITERLEGKICTIFGDGTTSRDFCYVTNVVQANLLSAFSKQSKKAEVYNVALGDETSLNELYSIIDREISKGAEQKAPQYKDFRVGDVKHSRADISKIQTQIDYKPGIKVKEGLSLVVNWYKGV